MAQDNIDVAVIGGGISGVYSAWLLRNADPSHLPDDLSERAKRRKDGRLRVALFEFSDRIGGRLLSIRLPGVATVVELGGMRFIRGARAHKRVAGLVERFGLQEEVLPVSDPAQKQIYHLRGQSFVGADWNRLDFEPQYRLQRGETARSPGELLIEVAIKHADSVARYPERYRNLGFWNLLFTELSGEAYQLIRDAGGYETIVNNWSAAAAIPFLLADFAPDTTYLRLVDGFERLPQVIAESFETDGGEIHLGHRLHRIDRADASALSLTFDVQGNQHAFGRRITGRSMTCTAGHVILALPRRAVEMLHPDSVIFDQPGFEDDLRSVLAQPGFKIFAAYRRPWWQIARGVTSGRSVTDLPLRQCYYWRTGQAESATDNSILMASYNDGSSVEFWAGLARRPEVYQPPLHACPPGVPIPTGDDLRGTIAPAALVDEMQRQLRDLHSLADLSGIGGTSVPFVSPYVAVFRDWSKEPYGGGWHFWKIGVDVPRVMRRMLRPIPGLPLYVCGEAWSSQQGWVEGALETADAVLKDQFGIDATT